MSTSIWSTSVKIVREHVVMIETPGGCGTGFIVPPPPGSEGSCIVTARHVIDHADDWHEPIRVTHFPSGKRVFLDPNTREINSARSRDQAFILFSAEDLPLPQAPLILAKVDTRYNEGVEIGWLGFPSVAPSALCFFCGHISAWLEADEAYLVDGVAINGVSGGPAFFQDEKDNPVVIGLVTEYRPNFATGKALPGVSLVRSINPLMKHYTQRQQELTAAKVQDIPLDQHSEVPPVRNPDAE